VTLLHDKGDHGVDGEGSDDEEKGKGLVAFHLCLSLV